jgi:hypothetical protein
MLREEYDGQAAADGTRRRNGTRVHEITRYYSGY